METTPGLNTAAAAARAKALAFIKKNFIGTIATVSAAGAPQASMVYYACDDRFVIYFSTLTSTRKYAAIQAHPVAAFTISTLDVPQTLQLEGAVSLVTEEEQMEQGIAQLIEPLMSNKNYQWPVAKLSRAEVVLLRIVPTWVRWGDFANFEQGTERVFTEISIG